MNQATTLAKGFKRYYHCSLKEDALETLANNGVSLCLDSFEEIFYDNTNDELIARNCWLSKRVYDNQRVEWQLKEQVRRHQFVLGFKPHKGEDACKKRLQELFGTVVEDIQKSFPVVRACYGTFRYRTSPESSWWIDVARFRSDMWYLTVNFDLGPSVSWKEYRKNVPISEFLSDYPAPSKVVAYLHTFQPKVLQLFDLDFGGNIVATLPNCPLPIPAAQVRAQPIKYDEKSLPPPKIFNKKPLSEQRRKEIEKFIQ